MSPMSPEEKAYYAKVMADELRLNRIDAEVKMMYEQRRQAEVLAQYLTSFALSAEEIEKFLDCWRLDTNAGLTGGKEFFDKVTKHIVKRVD